MDYINLGRQLMRVLPDGNNTVTADLPIKIVEAVVPGYGLFTNAILHYLGFDISALMSYVVFAFIAKRALSFFWTRIYATFLEYCTSYVHIDGNDDLYKIVLQWIAATRPDLSRRSLTATTQFGSVQETDDEDADVLTEIAVDNRGFFNFNKWSARVPPTYEPYYGSFWFSCSMGYFKFSKTERKLRNSEGGDSVEKSITIRCVGINANPVKRFLVDAKSWSIKKQSTKTAIRIPVSGHRMYSSSLWLKASERPSRPMDTVILDPEEKSRILQDMNEYLHPQSPKWYANRGIPYRRGYLFHGPPGTGKTSLSFALAGIFGLDIHIIALMDPSMSESYLSRLFNSLPKRCIVLLEDIDSAGLMKRSDDDDESDTESQSKKERSSERFQKARAKRNEGSEKADAETDKESEKPGNHTVKGTTNGEITNGIPTKHTNGETPNDSTPKDAHSKDQNGTEQNTDKEAEQTVAETDSKGEEKEEKEDDTKIGVRELARAIVEAGSTTKRMLSREIRQNKDKKSSNISLSGLLNAIDGVATHEGRILLMTTNHPEKLDPALIRAGRVDMQIRFTNATKLQIRHLFLRMYTGTELKSFSQGNLKPASDTGVSAEELEDLATRFADEIPDQKFAPSDIQGFLLLHRRYPRVALEKVAEWRDDKLGDLEEQEESEKIKAEEKAEKKKREAEKDENVI